MASFADEFRLAYLAKCGFISRKMEMMHRVREIRKQRALLNALLGKSPSAKPLCPVLLGCAFNRVYVTSIGGFPPYEYANGYFYPVGFESKRRHKRHLGCTKTKKERLQYVCAVTENGLSITAEDGRVWSGENCWEQFAASADESGEFSGFAEFSGLSDPKIIQLIESLNDTSGYPDYVPYKARLH